MNNYLKNGTLFDTKNGNIVPCRTTNPESQKLAAPPWYNLPGNCFLILNVNSKNT
jgi:hypothetical protein